MVSRYSFLNLLRWGIAFSLGAALLITTTACAPERIDGSSVSESEEALHNQITEAINAGGVLDLHIGDNLTINALVETPEVQPYNKVFGDYIRFDQEAWGIANKIFEDEKFDLYTSVDDKELDIPGSTYYAFEGVNGSHLVIRAGQIHYSTAQHEKNTSALVYQPHVKRIQPYEEGVLEGFPVDNALEVASDTISMLGLSNLGEPAVYAMKKDALNQESANYARSNGQGLEPNVFSEEEEYYTIIYRFEYDSFPITSTMPSYSSTAGATSPLGSYVSMEVGKNGLVCVTVNAAYEIDSHGNTVEDALTLEEAISILAQKYSNVLSKESINIGSIEYAYCPTYSRDTEAVFSFVPAWVFSFSESPDSAIRVNAIDGSIF